MSDILTKSGIAGLPAITGTPGSPGTPAQPAYCITTVTQVPQYELTRVYTGGSYVDVLTYIGTNPVTTRTCYPSVPAVPPSPSGPGSAATPYNFQIGWNSGAVSIGNLTGDGEYSFTAPSNVVGVVSGLATADVQGRYQALQWGFYLHSGVFDVRESGLSVLSGGTYVSTDVFRVVRVGATIQYFQNSTLLYTSAVPAPGTLVADGCLYMAGDSIVNAALTTTITHQTIIGQVASGKLKKLFGWGSNSASTGYELYGSLKKLVGSAVVTFTGAASGTLKKLGGTPNIEAGFVQDCEAVIKKVTGYAASGLLAPQFAIVGAYLPKLVDFSYSDNLNFTIVQATLRPLSGWGADSATTFYEPYGKLEKLAGFSTDNTQPYGWFAGQLGDGVNATYGLFAQGHQDVDIEYGFFGQLSGYSFNAQGGAQYRGTFQTPYGLSASGTVTSLGEFYGKLSGWQQSLMASGTGTQMGRAYLTYGGDYSVLGLGGAQFRGKTGGQYVVTATGSAGILGEFRGGIKPHHYIVTASGTQRNFAVVNGGLIIARSVNDGRAIMRGRFSLVSHGYQNVTPTYEGYSITFLGDKEVPALEEFATSHYTDFPFIMLGRFGNSYYGVGPTGIFTMDEDTLPSSAPIVSVFKTGESDVGEPTLKRARSLWLGGRMDGAFSLDVTSSEIEDDAYSYTYTLNGARKYRMKVGRGIEATYLAYTISNTDGADFEVQELSPEVDVLRRSA